MVSSLKLSELVPGLKHTQERALDDLATHGMAFTRLAQVKTEGEPCYVDPMAISLTQIRHELLPGLAAVQCRERYAFAYHDWRGVFGTYETALAAPHVWIPTPPLPIAVAAAAAAVIVKNPIVTRRFWQGWFTGGAK